jgi:hypothetical protein
MNYYYLDEQSREIGPVSLENLKAFRAAGVTNDQTLVRPESGGPWAACVTVTGIVETSDPGNLKGEAAKVISTALSDAKSALSLLATNPVGGLAPAYQKLGPKRAASVGILFMIIYAAVGAFLMNHLIGTMTSMNYGGVNVDVDSAKLTKLLFVAAASAAAWFSALALVRLMNQRGGQWEGDAFIAGAVSLLWAMAIMLTSLFGWKNFEVCGVLALTTICITVLQIFAGLTRISGLSEPRATLAVPVVLICEVWITKIIFTTIYG